MVCWVPTAPPSGLGMFDCAAVYPGIPCYTRASKRLASSMALSVMPPAEWVDKASVTLFQGLSMSGWWFAFSAKVRLG
jgi:hypothetical protein